MGYTDNVRRVYYNDSQPRSYVTYSQPSQYVSHRPVETQYISNRPVERVVYNPTTSYTNTPIESYSGRPVRVSYRRIQDPREVATRSYVTNTNTYLSSPIEYPYSTYPKSEKVVVHDEVEDNEEHHGDERRV